MADRSDIIIENYEVSPRIGFLPDKPPLARLPHPYYARWEETVSRVAPSRGDGRAREYIDEMPLLSTGTLRTLPEWHRAYTLLSILSQIYIWDGDEPSNRIPASIASPLLGASEHLGLNPCASFASFCLWNIRPVGRYGLNYAAAYEPENLRQITSFTGTTDEQWFFSISAAIEARGGCLIPGMFEAIEAAREGNSHRVQEFLGTFANCILHMCKDLERMYEGCAPSIFYHDVRPFLNGGKGVNKDTQTPAGVFYENESGGGQWHQYDGGSNAQSSLIQLLDIFLGVDHSITAANKPHDGYHREMQSYMPGKHRQLLQVMSRLSNVREFVLCHPVTADIRIAYSRAAAELAALRQTHMIMAARYIVMQGRKGSMCRDSSKGTGGTEFMPFLKDARDGTLATCCPRP